MKHVLDIHFANTVQLVYMFWETCNSRMKKIHNRLWLLNLPTPAPTLKQSISYKALYLLMGAVGADLVYSLGERLSLLLLTKYRLHPVDKP